MKIANTIILLLFVSTQCCADTISSISGIADDGEAITLVGTFTTKPTAAPICFDDFETGAVDGEYLKDNTEDDYDWEKYGTVSYGDGADYQTTQKYSGSFSAAHEDDAYTLRTCWQTFTATDKVYLSYWYWVDRTGTLGTPVIKLARITSDESVPLHYGRPGSLHIQWQPSSDWTYSQYNPSSSVDDRVQISLSPDIAEDGWQRIEMYIEASTPGSADGRVWITVDGTVSQDNASILTRSSGETWQYNSITLGLMLEVATADWNFYNDDVYVDNTPQRVEVWNATTKAASTKFGWIVPESWSTNSIQGEAHLPKFEDGETAYVVVYGDDNNESNKFPITIGSGSVAGETVISGKCLITGSVSITKG